MLARHSDSAGPTSRASWCRTSRPGNYSNYLSRHFCSIKNYDNLLLIAVTRIWLVEVANLTNGMSELLCEVKVTQNERQVKRAMRYHSKTILENDCTKLETGLCQIWVMSVEMITYVQKVPRRHKTLNQRWFYVGPLSTTLDQRWTNIDSTSCVCCKIYEWTSLICSAPNWRLVAKTRNSQMKTISRRLTGFLGTPRWHAGEGLTSYLL